MAAEAREAELMSKGETSLGDVRVSDVEFQQKCREAIKTGRCPLCGQLEARARLVSAITLAVILLGGVLLVQLPAIIQAIKSS